MELHRLIDDVYKLATEDEFCEYLRENFEDIQQIFKGQNFHTLNDYKYKISDLYYDIEKNLLRGREQEIVAFNSILADFFERFRLSAETLSLYNLLDDGPVKNRVKACILYLRIKDVHEYLINFDEIVKYLSIAYEEEDFPKKLNLSLANYFFTAHDYLHIKYSDILENLRIKFIDNADNIPFLSDDLKFKIESGSVSENDIYEYINNCDSSDFIIINEIIDDNEHEISDFATDFSRCHITNFDRIINFNRDYLLEDLHDSLGRGIEIIDNEQMLCQYIKSYGHMHKEKLIDSFATFDFTHLEGNQIEIIDWGCGQAIATYVFLEYITNKKIKLDIKSIKLIEPSNLALKRGLLYLNQLNTKIKIKAINKDIDNLEDRDLTTNNKAVKIHFFSNILDVPSFKLSTLISRLKKTQQDINYFFCVSPYIDESKNMRIETFYKNFEENYDTTLISSRKNSKDDDFWKCCNSVNDKQCKTHNNYGCSRKWTRYEKIFKTTITY